MEVPHKHTKHTKHTKHNQSSTQKVGHRGLVLTSQCMVFDVALILPPGYASADNPSTFTWGLISF